MKKTLVAAATASIIALAIASPIALASSDTTICRGLIGEETVINVRVPQNATCNLTDTDVRGNVDIRAGASLAASGVDVGGSVTAKGYQLVRVDGTSSVDGDVRLRAGRTGGTGIVSSNTIGGDLRIEENFSRVTADSNAIDGDLRVEKNRGAVILTNNDVSEDLRCKDNRPAPTGSGNSADKKDGQCSRL